MNDVLKINMLGHETILFHHFLIVCAHNQMYDQLHNHMLVVVSVVEIVEKTLVQLAIVFLGRSALRNFHHFLSQLPYLNKEGVIHL